MAVDADNAQKADSQRPILGIALMGIASLVVPVVDGIAKLLSADMSPFCIAFGRYFVAALVVLPIGTAYAQGGRSTTTTVAMNGVRTVLTVGAMTCFFFAIRHIPLATAFGGYFLGPVIAAVLAAPVLGERMTVLRAAAAIVGVIGAFLIVQPSADFKPGTVLAVLSGVLFAGYLMTTRIAASAASPLVALRFQCVFGALLLLPFAIASWTWPTGQQLVLLATMGLISAGCHFLVIAAFRYGEAIILSPLSYLELTTAVVFGLLVFSELPNVLAGAGIGLVVGSGLLIWISERRKSPKSGLVKAPAN